ncbi:endonuclease Q family protein [Patescibacteria group bacterium]
MADYITDLHIHSPHSRDTSKEMTLENTSMWAQKKGISVLGAGDFTNQDWLKELQAKLMPAENGLYRLKDSAEEINYLLSAEITCAFTALERARRMDLIIIAPSFSTVEKINSQLSWIADIKNIGQPMVEIEAKELARIVLEASPDCAVLPAHIWDLSSALFSGRDGFDAIDECFKEMTIKIDALETGLASDPPMNWRLSQLDAFQITSFSGARNLTDLGREATIFSLNELSYKNIITALRNPTDDIKISSTIEVFPQLNEFYYDGHQNCHIRFSPKDTFSHEGFCPACSKPLTLGVMNRLEQLADRPEGFAKPENRPPYRHMASLIDIIATANNSKKTDKTVMVEYDRIVTETMPELKLLAENSLNQFSGVISAKIIESIKRVQAGTINITPGYDGVSGVLDVIASEADELAGQDKLL